MSRTAGPTVKGIAALSAFHQIADVAAHIGPWLVGIGIAGFVTAIFIASLCMLFTGRSDGTEGQVQTVRGPLPWQMPGIVPRGRGIIKEKILVSREATISNEALASGATSRGERLIVASIIGMVFCIGIAILGAGLWSLKRQPIVMLVVIPFEYVLGLNVYNMRHDFLKAKANVARRKRRQRSD